MRDCVLRYYEKYEEDIREGVCLEEVLSDLHCTKDELISTLEELWNSCGIAYEIKYNALFSGDVIYIWQLLTR